MKQQWIAAWQVVLLALLPIVARGSEQLSVGGYYKSFSVAYDMPDYRTSSLLPHQPVMGSVSNRVRLNAHYRLSSRLALNASYNFVSRIQDSMLFTDEPFLFGVDAASYRLADLDERLYPGKGKRVGSFAIFQNLDRACLVIGADRFDLYVGRQAIAWGSARVINPTDVIAPYTYHELDTEDRIGVDAVRFRIPLGFMGEIDAGYVFGDDFEFVQSAVFLRGKFYTARTDISLLLAGFRENLLLGFDLARSIGGAGVWAEGACVLVDALDSDDIDSHGDYFRGSTGLDYSFSGDIYGFVEYHFNGAGRCNADEFAGNLSHTAFTEAATYLMGKHYLAPGMTHQITPLITLGAEALVNLTDPSMLFSPSLEYNIAEDIYLAAGAYIGTGRRPRLVTDSDPPSTRAEFRSEFGSYADIYHASFRVYF